MRTSDPAPAGRPRWFLVLLVDLLLILLFAALGRDTHQHGLSPTGIFVTASPFLIACVAGWSVSRSWDTPHALWPAGVLVWLVTVIGGLALRGFFGGGLAASFQIVTLVVLGAFLLGHRAVLTVFDRAKARRNPTRT